MEIKKTKIICTIGPASSSVDEIRSLIVAGMDAARLNFSHGNRELHAGYIDNIRKAASECGKIITIIQDLSGPKIRIGEIEGGEVVLNKGTVVKLTDQEITGNASLLPTNYPGLLNDITVGETILLDDGKLNLKVINIDRDAGEFDCEVIVGGVLKQRKGINLPNTRLTMPSLTDKDLEDITFGVKHNVDAVAMSFVRKADDIHHLKNILRNEGTDSPVIAKIERPEAVDNIDAIIEASDAIMVARGDMGVEISTEDVPVIQKMIIRKCNEKIKPVITATQMLESMISNPSPTRAEASDISNAILDGTDCVMLSAETSTGRYPSLAVETMSKIIRKTEKIQVTSYFEDIFIEDSPENTLHTICNSAVEIATRVKAKAIVTITHTGKSPLLLSNHRPSCMILAATYEEKIIKRCKLIWGVESILIKPSDSFYATLLMIREVLRNTEIMREGEKIVVISPMPFSDSESANMIQVTTV